MRDFDEKLLTFEGLNQDIKDIRESGKELLADTDQASKIFA